jgi:hypothetical protein
LLLLLLLHVEKLLLVPLLVWHHLLAPLWQNRTLLLLLG